MFKTNDALQVLLTEYFDLRKTEIILELSHFFASKKNFSIRVGRYTALVNIKQGYVVSNNITHIIDYFSLIEHLSTLENVSEIKYLDDEEFNQLHNKITMINADMVNLNIVLWQLFDNIIEKNLTYTQHNLTLHIKYMPNIKAMGNTVPKHLLEIFSYCLMKPKTITEIAEIFQRYHMPIQEINRLLLLAILSNFAYLPSIKQDSPPTEHEPSVIIDNKGIKQAKKTGFLQRLLSSFVKSL